MGKQWNQCQIYFFGLQNHCRWWLQPWNLKTLAPRKKSYGQTRQHIKKQRHCFVDKSMSSQSYGFSSSHVCMWELDYKESWALKNWCFWTVVMEKTFESPLDCKQVHPVHLKGNQSWIFIRRTDAEAETPILWPVSLSSVQFSCSVVSNSLWPNRLQHARPPCPSPTPGAYSNSCPLSWWCHPTILSSVIPFSSCRQSFPASASFAISQFFAIRWPKY